MPLSGEHFRIAELLFGTRFHIDVFLSKDAGERFYREITRAHSRLFTTPIIQEGAFFAYRHERTKAQLLLFPNNLQFSQGDPGHDSEQFLGYWASLIDKFVQVFEYPSDRFRMFGKVYRYRVEHAGLFDAFRRTTGMFTKDDISTLLLRTRFVEEDKNIHIQISTAENAKQEPDVLAIECDINTFDQELDHNRDEMEGIVRFADEFNKNRLIPFVAERLPI